jgi:hypothetical protein
VYLVNYQYSDNVISVPDMKRIRHTPQNSNNFPQNGSQLTVDERLKIIASLMVEKIMAKQRENLANERNNHYGLPT